MHTQLRITTLLSFFIFSTGTVFADKEISGIIKNNINTKVYAIDPDASAIILSEKKAIYLVYDNGGLIRKEYRHKIIKILKPDAFGLADIQIYYSEKDHRNYVHNIKATTYNLSDGVITASSVNSEDLLGKKIRGNTYRVSFSLPAVKAGSIIDYSYEEVSEYYASFFSWQVQGSYPKLSSEFVMEYPERVEFTSISRVGCVEKIYPSEEDALAGTDSFCYVKSVRGGNVRSYWVRKNIPGVRLEPYVTNIHNYTERLDMQATGVTGGYGAVHFNNSWAKVNENLWTKGGIRKMVEDSYGFMDEIVDSVRKLDTSVLVRTRALYSYVRANFKTNNEADNFTRSELKDIFYRKEGSSNELNLFLISLLQNAGIEAHPLLLSTSDNIRASKVFPVIDRLDRLVSIVKIGGDYILLDPSGKYNPFGMLKPDCYNGFAWILGDEGHGIELSADLIKDKTTFGVRVFGFSDSSAKMEIVQKFGMVRSGQLRREWGLDEDKINDYMAKQEQHFPGDVTVLNHTIENVKDPDASIVIKYDCRMDFAKNAKSISLNAVLLRYFEKNPFIATHRVLPIEFPYKFQYTYYINVALPGEMKVEGSFQPVSVELDGGAASYKKTTAFYEGINTIALNAVLSMDAATYDVGKYNAMREFFQTVIDDNNQVLTIKRSE